MDQFGSTPLEQLMFMLLLPYFELHTWGDQGITGQVVVLGGSMLLFVLGFRFGFSFMGKLLRRMTYAEQVREANSIRRMRQINAAKDAAMGLSIPRVPYKARKLR
jgi:hypothetical protein